MDYEYIKVRKGHWINQSNKVPYCSECGEHSDDAESRDGNFCQSCGAIMSKTIEGNIRVLDVDTLQTYGNWRYKGKKATYPWECIACGVYQCDNPVSVCPECGNSMNLPVEEIK